MDTILASQFQTHLLLNSIVLKLFKKVIQFTIMSIKILMVS
jgi:hypothetical protein